MVWTPKLDGLVSLKTAAAPGQQNRQWMPKDSYFDDGSGGSQSQTRPRSETLVNDKAKPNAERSLEEVAIEQIKDQGEKIEASVEAETSSQQPPNWAIWFHRVQDRRGR
jgi:hypothetical protein